MDIQRPTVSRRLAPLIGTLSWERGRLVLAIARRAENWEAFLAELEAGGFPVHQFSELAV